jgi:hypothetical protein
MDETDAHRDPQMVVSDPTSPQPVTMKCPACAEEILAEAKKCKHCGEWVDSVVLPENDKASVAVSGAEPMGRMVEKGRTGRQAWVCFAHEKAFCNQCRTITPTSPQDDPVWARKGTKGGYRCVAHGKLVCMPCQRLMPSSEALKRDKILQRTSEPGGYSGKVGHRVNLTDIATPGEDGPKCPKCGGTQFTAKRAKKGFVLVGVGALVAPKSQLKCVTCGTMFKRG